MKTSKKKKILITVGLIAPFLLIIGGVFVNKVSNRVTNSPVISSSDRNDEWTKDIEFLEYYLPKKHKNLLFYKSKEEFNEEMDSLLRNISTYTDEEIGGELVKLIVSINDSHTRAGLVNSTVYPLKFFEFEEGIYLIDGSLEYKDY